MQQKVGNVKLNEEPHTVGHILQN